MVNKTNATADVCHIKIKEPIRQLPTMTTWPKRTADVSFVPLSFGVVKNQFASGFPSEPVMWWDVCWTASNGSWALLQNDNNMAWSLCCRREWLTHAYQSVCSASAKWLLEKIKAVIRDREASALIFNVGNGLRGSDGVILLRGVVR